MAEAGAKGQSNAGGVERRGKAVAGYIGDQRNHPTVRQLYQVVIIAAQLAFGTVIQIGFQRTVALLQARQQSSVEFARLVQVPFQGVDSCLRRHPCLDQCAHLSSNGYSVDCKADQERKLLVEYGLSGLVAQRSNLAERGDKDRQGPCRHEISGARRAPKHHNAGNQDCGTAKRAESIRGKSRSLSGEEGQRQR